LCEGIVGVVEDQHPGTGKVWRECDAQQSVVVFLKVVFGRIRYPIRNIQKRLTQHHTVFQDINPSFLSNEK